MAGAVPPLPEQLFSADSNDLPGDPPKPSKKRKAPAAINISSSSSEETKDTASTDYIEDEEVGLPDDLVYQELDEYEFQNGFNPAVEREHMRRYCLPYIHLGIGTKSAWATKIRRMRLKFKIESASLVPPEEKEQFLLWKKLFKRDPPPDSGSMT